MQSGTATRWLIFAAICAILAALCGCIDVISQLLLLIEEEF